MEARYNVYFAGQCLDGHDPATVRGNLGKLFKADENTLDKLFSGKSQLVKRDCDKATALKYKQAMEQAGALPEIKTIAAESASTAVTAEDRPTTAAERIAALAAAPDLAYQQQRDVTAAGSQSPDSESEEAGDIRLAPAGTAVLLPEERPAPAVSSVNPPDLEISASGQRLSEPLPSPPPAPDTSHLRTAAVGELLPNLRSGQTPQPPDTSAIELSPEGGDLSDCAAPAPTPPALDLSDIELAPAGADVLEPQYRKKHDQPLPATDHITLSE